jgi:wobble nucleotide-excising tRNase
MADIKKDEKKEEKVYKFKPIVAMAKKLPQIDGNDVFEINVPIEEDSDALVGEATKRAKRDNRNKNNIDKEGELDMDEAAIEAAIDARVNKKLMEMDVQKTIKDVGTVTLKTLENMNTLEEKLKRHDDYLVAIRKQQTDACNGVDCVKDEVENIKTSISGTNEKLSDIAKKIESIDSKTDKIHEKPEGAICSGRTGCGHEIDIGSSYCPNCGKEIESWEGMEDWVSYNKRRK